ncbi:MAG: molybdopterin molybdotransferase MoeA [Pirellulaceae bacterium]|jgi:molybdopterin molybdotransferase|nr:molybdopterin molybdotransferase MoeA [Pirellulaceae bacterium]MDP7017113.1 molybdopterin molybdotransferase MoeA [Pirellulaceae bacterium]
MISIEDALAAVLAAAQPNPPAEVPVADALSRQLAADIISSLDSPPHDKAMVDGYALIAADVASIPARLNVLEEVTCGRLPSRPVTSGSATRIMTGAPVPEGADSVVMIEQTSVDGDGGDEHVVIRAETRPGANIMRQGSSIRRGDCVLKRGAEIRAIEIGLLCEVGQAMAPVHARPTVAVVATGDELVDVGAAPGPGQIHNSNGPMIQSQALAAGADAVDLGIAPDLREPLENLIDDGLQHDVLVLSGGVSAGVLDLVPAALKSQGVVEVFHKVHIKPGKPLWFGCKSTGAGKRLVFGLPGNPVSSLVCFELFVRPAIEKLAGLDFETPMIHATLTNDHRQKGGRPTFFPGRCEDQSKATAGRPIVSALTWQGSADLCGLANANCLIYFPPGDREFKSGEMVAVRMF